MTDRLSDDPIPEFNRDAMVQASIRSKAMDLKAFIEQMGPEHQANARAIIASVFGISR